MSGNNFVMKPRQIAANFVKEIGQNPANFVMKLLGNKEEYNRGNYGAKDDTLKSLDYMLKSVVQFMEMLRDEATTDEEMQLIKKYARKISEM